MNKREIGSSYRIEALKVLGHLGYASTRQLAKAVLGGCDESKRKMIGRTMRWLQKERMVVSKREGPGINTVNYELLYAMTELGVSTLKMAAGEVIVGDKLHARDYLRHAHPHRTACNSAYVALDQAAARWSELEIRNGSGPIDRLSYWFEDKEQSKIPDLIAMPPESEKWIWIEVENAWRSDKDLTKMIASMRAMFRSDTGISRVLFVVTVEGAKTIGKRLRQKLTHAPDSGWAVQIRQLDARILNEHISVWELDRSTLTLSPLSI